MNEALRFILELWAVEAAAMTIIAFAVLIMTIIVHKRGYVYETKERLWCCGALVAIGVGLPFAVLYGIYYVITKGFFMIKDLGAQA